jgi:hypothetical protein
MHAVIRFFFHYVTYFQIAAPKKRHKHYCDNQSILIGYSIKDNLQPKLAWLQERLLLDGLPKEQTFENATTRKISKRPLFCASLENRLKPRLAKAEKNGRRIVVHQCVTRLSADEAFENSTALMERYLFHGVRHIRSGFGHWADYRRCKDGDIETKSPN